MISLQAFFWLMVGFFALIGALRGWTREVIATAGLVLSLFALNQLGNVLLSFAGLAIDPNVPITDINSQRQRFYIYSAMHILIAFVSYQGPLLAGSRIGDRLRVRDTFQDKIMGALVGSVNGYLIVGTLWWYLHSLGYPFDPTTLSAPQNLEWMIAWLPIPLLGAYLPLLVVAVFLFVIVVLI